MKKYLYVICAYIIIANITNAQNSKNFDIRKYDTVKIFKCDHLANKVIGIYDLKNRNIIKNIAGEPDQQLVLLPGFREHPNFYKNLIVLKNKATNQIIITVVNNGEFSITGIPNIKVTSVVNNLTTKNTIVDFLDLNRKMERSRERGE